MEKPAVVSTRANLSFKIPPAQRALLNNLTEGSVVIDRQRRVVLLNRAGERLLGLKNSQIAGKKYVDVIGSARRPDGKLIPQKDRPLIKTLTRKKAVKDRIISYHRQDGATISLKVNAAPYKNEAGKIVGAIGTFTDVTSEVQAEDALAKNEIKYRGLFENMSSGVAVYQPVNGGNDFIFTGFNRAAEKIDNISRDQVIGRRVTEVFPGVRKMGLFKVFQNVYRTGKPEFIGPGFYIDKRGPGTYRENHVYKQPNGEIVAVYNDVTERILAQAEIEKIARFPGENPNPVLRVDKNGTILYANAAAKPVLDYWQKKVGEKITGAFLLTVKELFKSRRPLETEIAISGRILQLNLHTMPGTDYLNIYGRDVTAQKTAENAVRDSEVRYRRLFEAAKDGILILDANTGTIIDVNPFLVKMMELTEKSFLGKQLWELGFFKDIIANKENLAELQQKKYIRYEDLPLKTASGRQFDVEFISNVYEVDHMKIIQCNIRDITERKKAETALSESETNLKIAQRAAHTGSWRWNIKTGQVFWSDEMFRIFGIAQATFTGDLNEIIRQAIHPEDRARVEASNVSVMTKAKPVALEYRIIRPDGTVRVVWAEAGELKLDDDGKPEFLSGFVQDITERKAAEALLRQSQSLAQLTLDSLSAHICVVDADGVILAVNRGWQKFALANGADMAKIGIGTSYFKTTEGTRGEDAPSAQVFLEGIKKVLSGQTDYFEMEYPCHSPTEQRWFNGRVTPQIETDTGIYRVVISHLNITSRKKTEEALRITEENFHNSIAQSPMAIQILSAAGNVIYANRRMVELFGYETVEELRAVPYEQRVSPETRQAYLKRQELRRQGKEPLNFDITIIRKDGVPRQVRVYGSRVLWDGQLLYQWVYEDVTEIFEAEESLRKTEENFRNTLDNSPFGIRIVSIAGDTLYANHAILDLYGFKDIEEFLATPTQKRYTPESYAEHIIRKEKRNRGEPTDSEYTVSIFTTSGEIKHLRVFRKEVLWDGKKQYQVLYQDYTQSVEALQNLERSQQRFRDLADMLPQTVWETDINGDFTYSNAEAKRSLRVDINNIRKTNFLDIVAPEDRERARVNFRRVISGETLYDIEYNNIREDGTKFPVLIYAAPIVIDNKITGMRGISVDITERKRMQIQMIATDRLASIGELASGVAHELNNPLTSIIGFSELLLNRELPEDIKEDVRLIHREAERTAIIVRNLLTFARRRKEERRLTDINATIRLVLDMRHHEHTVRNIQVITGLADDLPPILVDDFQIQQVFFNIVINAEYFMTEAHGKGVLDVITRRHGDYLRIIIKDDGPGISPEIIHHLFDPFFTTKEVGKGTGLGLSICHGIITSHQGDIRVESEPGKGTEFTIDLPLIVTENTTRKEYLED